MQDYELWRANGLAGVINILDPDVIVLSGSLSNIERLYQNVPPLWQYSVFSDQVSIRLVKARYGDSSGVRGAAWLWQHLSDGLPEAGDQTEIQWPAGCVHGPGIHCDENW